MSSERGFELNCQTLPSVDTRSASLFRQSETREKGSFLLKKICFHFSVLFVTSRACGARGSRAGRTKRTNLIYVAAVRCANRGFNFRKAERCSVWGQQLHRRALSPKGCRRSKSTGVIHGDRKRLNSSCKGMRVHAPGNHHSNGDLQFP